MRLVEQHESAQHRRADLDPGVVGAVSRAPPAVRERHGESSHEQPWDQVVEVIGRELRQTPEPDGVGGDVGATQLLEGVRRPPAVVVDRHEGHVDGGEGTDEGCGCQERAAPVAAAQQPQQQRRDEEAGPEFERRPDGERNGRARRPTAPPQVEGAHGRGDDEVVPVVEGVPDQRGASRPQQGAPTHHRAEQPGRQEGEGGERQCGGGEVVGGVVDDQRRHPRGDAGEDGVLEHAAGQLAVDQRAVDVGEPSLGQAAGVVQVLDVVAAQQPVPVAAVVGLALGLQLVAGDEEHAGQQEQYGGDPPAVDHRRQARPGRRGARPRPRPAGRTARDSRHRR